MSQCPSYWCVMTLHNDWNTLEYFDIRVILLCAIMWIKLWHFQRGKSLNVHRKKICLQELRWEVTFTGGSGRSTLIIIGKAHNRMTLIAISSFWMFEEGLIKLPADVPIQNSSLNFEEEFQTERRPVIVKHESCSKFKILL